MCRGSGAGGGLIASVLAQAGLDVVVLEAGGNFHEPDFTGLELPAFQQLFWRGGPTPAPTSISVSWQPLRSAAGRPSTGPTACGPRRTSASSGRANSASTAWTAPTSTTIWTPCGHGWASTIAARTSTGHTNACVKAPASWAGRSRNSAGTRTRTPIRLRQRVSSAWAIARVPSSMSDAPIYATRWRPELG